MKHVDRVFVKDVVQDFKQIAVAVKADKEIFLFLVRHNMVIPRVVKGMTNIRLTHTVLEGSGLENDVFIHRDGITQVIHIFKAKRNNYYGGFLCPLVSY
jgi:hypothetical protein